jgi:hypothetical protein
MDPYEAIRYYLYVKIQKIFDCILKSTKVIDVEGIVRLKRLHELRGVESIECHEPSVSKDVTQRIADRWTDTTDLHISIQAIKICL